MKYLVFGLIGFVLFGGVFVAFHKSDSGAVIYQSETETEVTPEVESNPEEEQTDEKV